MKFDYCSDLHLEFDENYYGEPAPVISEILKNQTSDNLIIAGDLCVIGNIGDMDIEDTKKILNNFYQYAKSNWKNIYFVLGNHDYWRHTLSTAADLYKTLMPEVNVLSLYGNQIIELDNDVTLIGDTMWSDLTGKYLVQRDMNDYRMINSDNPISYTCDSEDTTKHFKISSERIFQYVDEHPNKQIVVITHHCPSMKSTESKSKYLISAYGSSLDEMIESRPNIKYWIHGHVHQPQDYMIGSTKILCNPRGYFGYEDKIVDCWQLKSFEV